MIPPIEIGDPRLPEKYWARIKVNETTGCWIWTGAARNKASEKKYAVLAYDGRTLQVSTLLREIFLADMDRDRWRTSMTCGNGICVNPHHLGLIDRTKCFKGEKEGQWHIRNVDKFGNCKVCRDRAARLRTEKLRREGKFKAGNKPKTNIVDNKVPRARPELTVFNDKPTGKIWRPEGWPEEVKVFG